ncbi:MAG: transposase [Anaerolineae bacterium]|nr:transposase [Anaerolineae bacterium]
MTTKYDARTHHRRSIRLKGWNYASEGAYFVTVCAYRGQSVFGMINDDKLSLSLIGHFVDLCWQTIPSHFPHVQLDMFIVMPNHFHGILWIVDDRFAAMQEPDVGATHGSPLPDEQLPTGPQRGSLGSIIGHFKSSVTRRLKKLPPPFEMPGHPIWQRDFYDQIIRNERHLNAVREYIDNNPLKWAEDKMHPDATLNQFNRAWRSQE